MRSSGAFFALFLLPLLPVAASARLDRTLAITVDDLPASEAINDDAPGTMSDVDRRNRIILEEFRQHHIRALGLVNEYKVQVSGERDRRTAVLEQWLDAGMELGNHTFSHLLFSTVSLSRFEDDTVRGDVVTSALLRARGQSERYFRHPGLNLGRSQEEENKFEGFLKQRGYQIAPVSVNFDDYKFNDVLGDALIRNDSQVARRVRTAYIDYAMAAFDNVEKDSDALFGRPIPQILLIHDSRIAQDELGLLLVDLERRGYRFISIDEALKDPAYGGREQFSGNLDRCYLCWSNRLVSAGRTITQPSPVPNWIESKSQALRK